MKKYIYIIFLILISCSNSNIKENNNNTEETKDFIFNTIDYHQFTERYGLNISETNRCPKGYEITGRCYVEQDTLSYLSSMMDKLCEEAKKIGGEGIINLKIKTGTKGVILSCKVIEKVKEPIKIKNKRSAQKEYNPKYQRDHLLEDPFK